MFSHYLNLLLSPPTKVSYALFSTLTNSRGKQKKTTQQYSVGRFDSLISAGVHSKVGKVVKPKSFKNAAAGQPFVFEGAGKNAGKSPFWVETSLRK